MAYLYKFRLLVDQFGWLGLVRIICYPVTTLVINPIRLGQTMWRCRVLLDGRWGEYLHFNPQMGLSSLFYWTAAANLYHYGRSGRSSHMSLGDFDLRQLDHYSLPSLYMYWGGSTVLLLTGMGAWWAGHLIWWGQSDPIRLAVVLALTLFSSTFFVNTFVLQNYNVLGWMFFPVGLFGLITGNWLLAAAAWLAASLGSITVVFIGAALSLAWSVHQGSIYPMLAITPAGLKLLSHFIRVETDWSELRHRAMVIMKAIGMTRAKVKYRYEKSGEPIWMLQFVPYLIFLAASWWLNGRAPFLYLVGLMIYVVNQKVSRFADIQSMYMMMASLTVTVLMTSANHWILLSGWLALSPLFTDIYRGNINKFILETPPVLGPFPIRPLLEAMDRFLAPVPDGRRVLLAFADPQETYYRVFDGYRVLIELPIYVASRRRI
ncbi:MAG: hypothetical protein HQK60_20010, partial [Deltaproteobacteria bacterium]|nr:hypothetical protein [Deltaproteobacteria bacterium]